MRIIELVIDEENEISGVDAISIVENPAIEENFIALKDQKKFKFEQVGDKKLLTGPLLIPNKPIFRKSGDDEYYIYFTRETIRKAAELYLKNGYQQNHTLEHDAKLRGMTLVESWLVEDETHDKSRKFGMDVPLGTWMGTIKVDNDDVWETFVKGDQPVKGFSIEGYFAEKVNLKSAVKFDNDEIEKQSTIAALREKLAYTPKRKKRELESFTDYPEAASNNAKRAIQYNDDIDNKCMTQVGKVRAQTLANKKAISEDVLIRTRAYLSRAKTYYKPDDKEACGTIAYLAWGGDAMLRYANAKLKGLGYESLFDQVINDDFAIIMDRLAYSTREKALEMAKDLSCDGYHEHELDGKTWFMPCFQHTIKK